MYVRSLEQPEKGYLIGSNAKRKVTPPTTSQICAKTFCIRQKPLEQKAFSIKKHAISLISPTKPNTSKTTPKNKELSTHLKLCRLICP